MSILPSVLTDGTAENVKFVDEEKNYLGKRTYRFDFDKGEFVTDTMIRCTKTTSSKQFLQEVVTKILSDDRFAYLIYPDNYGNEARHILSLDLPHEILISELQRAYTEALIYHPLIDEVVDFKATVMIDKALVSFTVVGTSGDEILIERSEELG